MDEVVQAQDSESKETVEKLVITEVQCPDPNDANRQLAIILRLCMMECSTSTGRRIAEWAKRCGFPLGVV